MSIFSKFFGGGDGKGTEEVGSEEDEPTRVDAKALPLEPEPTREVAAPPVPSPPARAQQTAKAEAPRAARPAPAVTAPPLATSPAAAVRPPVAKPAPTPARREPTMGYDAGPRVQPDDKPLAAPPTKARAAPPATSASRPIVPARSQIVGGSRDAGARPAKPSTSEARSVFGEGLAGDADLERTLSAELDSRFDDLTKPAAPTLTDAERRAAAEADAKAARATFLDAAGPHLGVLREALLEALHGGACAEAASIGIAALRVVQNGANTLGDVEIVTKVEALANALEAARSASSEDERKERRDAIRAAHASLLPLFPSALSLAGEHDRREPILVRSLLLSVPGMEKLALERLFAAGLGRLSFLLRAKADEIAVTTGVSGETARAVAARVAEYVAEGSGTAVALDRETERRKLAGLLAELRREHEAFDRAAARWSDGDLDEKRARRRARELVLRRIDLALARVGAVDRVAALERVPVERRIEQLATLANDAAAFAAATATA